jgi:hypothetical protein
MEVRRGWSSGQNHPVQLDALLQHVRVAKKRSGRRVWDTVLARSKWAATPFLENELLHEGLAERLAWPFRSKGHNARPGRHACL